MKPDETAIMNNYPRSRPWPPTPTVQELLAMIDNAVVDMHDDDARRVRRAVTNTSHIAWGADSYAGADCPLKLAGFRRSGYYGPWNVDGAERFTTVFDAAMNSFVGLHGPGMIGVRTDA